MRTTTLLVALVVALAACGAGPELAAEPSTTTTTMVPTTTTTEGATTSMPTIDPDLPIIDSARRDLAERLRVDPEEIEVLVAEEVTWPDGSLGCPEPGMSYTQSLVDGSRVVLQHDDRVYVYQAGSDHEPFLCPSEDKDGGHEFVPPPGFNE